MTDRERMTDHGDCGNDVAAYVLGALEPEEAEAFARHLRSCAICRDEVAAFEHVVDALPMAAPQYEVPRRLRRRVLRAVRAERKISGAGSRPGRRFDLPVPSRPMLAGALAVVIALAVLGGVELGSSGSGPRVIRATVGDAQLRLSGSHGQLVVEYLPPPPRGRIYELWLARGMSEPSPSTLFGVTSAGTADVGVPGSLRGVSRVMVTDEPLGGSRAPTTRPVILASLS